MIKIEILPFISYSYDSNIFLIKDKKTAVIDTGLEIDSRTLNNLKAEIDPGDVDFIINTHAHIDHCGGNTLFKNSSVYLHENDLEEFITGSFYNTAGLFGKTGRGKVDKSLKDGEIIDLGELKLKVVLTPGHSPGSICLYSREHSLLFSGDTLFTGGAFGRVDLEGGSVSDLINSLRAISEFDFKALYPGHGELSTYRGRKHAKKAKELAEEFL